MYVIYQSKVELAFNGWGVDLECARSLGDFGKPERAKIDFGSSSEPTSTLGARRGGLDRAKIDFGGVPSRPTSALDRSWSDFGRYWLEFRRPGKRVAGSARACTTSQQYQDV